MRRVQDLSDFINKVSRAERASIIWHQLKDFAGQFGMRSMLVLTVHHLKTRFRPAVLYADAPLKLIDALDREFPPQRNPVLRHVRDVMRPFLMSEMKSEPHSAQFDWRVFAPAKSRGEALVVPITDGKLDGVAVFSGKDLDTRPLARGLLQVATQFAFQRVRLLGGRSALEPRPPKGLTRRERDCLRLAAAGKTDSNIADTLGISLRTVRFHFANSKAKLGKVTRSAAIAATARAEA